MNICSPRTKRPLIQLVALSMMLATQVAPATSWASGGLSLAVSPFANKTGDTRFDAVSKGLADMLTTDLSVSTELRLVERERIAAVLAELKLGTSTFIDPKTAQRAGKLLGAELMLVGAITAWAPTLRLDARIVNVESGEVMVAASAAGPQAKFFAVEAELARKLLVGFGVRLSPLQRMRINKAPTQSWKALHAYAKGLDAHDRGNKPAAKAAFEAAIAADPAFARARQRLEKLGKRVAALEQRTTAVERAGGLILRPTSAVEHWSNHKVHSSRGDKTKARAAALAALTLEPGAIDALWALCLADLPGGGTGHTVDVGQAKVSSARVQLVCALAASNPVTAARLSQATVSGTVAISESPLAALAPDQVVAAYLRLRAIVAPVQPQPTADRRAEAVGLGLLLGAALRTKAGARALESAFLDGEQRAAANAFVATHLHRLGKGIEPGLQRRGALHAHTLKVALVEHVGRNNRLPFLLQVRFAAPNVSQVTVTLRTQTWQLVPRELEAGAEVAVWQVALDRSAPVGSSKLTVRWRDQDRLQRTDTRTWSLRATTAGSWRQRGQGLGARISGRHPMLSTHFLPRAKADLGGQLLVDPVVALWTKPLPIGDHALAIWPMFAGRPSIWATGELIDFARPGRGLSRIGLVRAIVYATGAGGGDVRVLGTARYYRWATTDEARYVSESGTTRAESGLHVRPIFEAPSTHTLALATAQRRAAALRAWQGYMAALPQTAALWELSTESGLYAALWTACPLARASGRQVARLRDLTLLGSQLHDARGGLTSWAPRLLAVCAKAPLFAAAWAQAEAADADGRVPGQRWRFRAEVATALVLGHGWPKPGAASAAAVRQALANAPGDSLEISLLTAAAVVAGASRPAEVAIHAKGGRSQVPAPASNAMSEKLVTTAFWLDRDEVTTAGYATCVAAGGCREPTDVACAHASGADHGDLFSSQQATHCIPVTPGLLPQNRIQQGDAARYCAWRGGRLPRSAELLTAAVNDEGRAPWHAQGWRGAYDNLRDRVVCAWLGYGRAKPEGCAADEASGRLPWDRYGWIAPAGAHPAGESPAGVAHLVGNLREWVRDGPNQAYGCSFLDTPSVPATCLRTLRPVATYSAEDVGFRCAYDARPRRSGAHVRQPKAPRIAWARVPGGLAQLGVPEQNDAARRAVGPSVDLANITAADVAAVARACPRTDAAGLRAFAADLAKLGITGRLSAPVVEELVSRALWSDRTPAQAFEAVLTLLRTFDATAFREAFDTNAYVAGARRRAGGDETKTRALLWSDVVARLLRQPRLPHPGAAPRWSARRGFDCRDQPLGRCQDVTGTSGARFASDARPRPAQAVRVAGFQMMTTEVTQRAFAAVLNREPSFFNCSNCAVERVSWTDADAFCRKIGARLPTEAEWAFAAAGGSADPRYGRIDDVAWYLGNSAGKPPSAGTRRPNKFGLYDMLGGVWEWTADGWLDRSALENLARGLKVVPKANIRRAPADAKPWCIHAYRHVRYGERNLDALPWTVFEKRWLACFDTESAGQAAVAAVLNKAPLGPSPLVLERPRPTLRTIRGGAWRTDPRLVTRTARAATREDQRSSFVGFRCAK